MRLAACGRHHEDSSADEHALRTRRTGAQRMRVSYAASRVKYGSRRHADGNSSIRANRG